MPSTGRASCRPKEPLGMKGYVVRKGNQYYAVIYEGRDPITGRERRRWHPAGPHREEADVLAAQLAHDRTRDPATRRSSLTVGVYLTQRWLPSKQVALRPSTWASYRNNIELHIVPAIGRVPLRHLRPDHIERLYADLLTAATPSVPVDSTARPCSRSTCRYAARSPTRNFAG
jgi:integrase